MRSLSSWLVAAGSLLGIASFFVPRFEIPAVGPEVFSPWSWACHLSRTSDPETILYQALLGAAPSIGSLLVGLAAPFRKGVPLLLQWSLAGFFFLWAFTLSTLGSIAATSSLGSEGSGSWALLEFTVPLVLAAIVLARMIGGSDPERTGAIVRASIGALLLLGSLVALGNPQLTAHSGAAVPALAGALLLVGTLVSLFRPAAPPAPDPASAPAVGNPS